MNSTPNPIGPIDSIGSTAPTPQNSPNSPTTPDQIIAQALEQSTAQEVADQQMLNQLLPFRISVADQYPPEVYLLENNGVGFFAKGDIHAIKAKQKNGKTNAISLMVAAILGGSWGPLRAALPMARVLVVDTEQKAADVQLVYNRTIQLAQLPLDDYFDRFQTFGLRSFTNEQKLKAVEVLIRNLKPDIVFIDGVVDLMGNFNEVDDSKTLIEHLMRLSTAEVSGAEVAIVCVLHTNKATEDHNMRGHAGTMLAQKSGTVLEVKKEDNIFTITNTDARHKEVPRWSYTFDENDHLVDADNLRADMAEEARQHRHEVRLQRQEKTLQQRIDAIMKTIAENGGLMQRNELSKRLQSLFRISNGTAYQIIRHAAEMNKIIIQDDNTVIINKKE